MWTIEQLCISPSTLPQPNNKLLQDSYKSYCKEILMDLRDLPFYHILRVQRHEILHQTISMKSSLLGETIFANISECTIMIFRQRSKTIICTTKRKRRAIFGCQMRTNSDQSRDSVPLTCCLSEENIWQVRQERRGMARLKLSPFVSTKSCLQNILFQVQKKTFQSYLYRTLFSSYIVLYCM